MSTASRPPLATQPRLLDAQEQRRAAARRRAGHVFAVVTLVPVILAVTLVAVLLLDTVLDTFSWQVVEPSSGVSGASFAYSRAPFGGEQVLRLELAARGLTPEEVEAFLNNPEEMRDFRARDRTELMWRASDGPALRPFRWVVTSSRNDDVADIPLFGVNSYLQGLQSDLQEDREDLEPEEAELLRGLEAANLSGGPLRAFANVGLLRDSANLDDDTRLYLNPWLDVSFFTKVASSRPVAAGLRTALAGTLWVIGLVILISVPTGVGAAIYLEEYAPDNRFTRFIEVNIRNLAGVPSIVYGILGLYLFVRLLRFGETIMAAALTLSLLILPVVIIAARESIRAVPGSLRQASYGLGATKWQTVSRVVMPNAVTGIVTGVILAVARAIGETAPLLLVGAAGFISFLPTSPFSQYSVIPVQIYSWIAENDVGFQHVAAAAIVTLLLILFVLYGIAFFIRRRFERSW